MNEELPKENVPLNTNTQSNGLSQTSNTPPPEVPTQVPPVASPMQKKPINKILLISLGVMAILLLGVGSVFSFRYYKNQITPSPSPEAMATISPQEDAQKALNVAIQLNNEQRNTNIQFKQYSYNGMTFKIPSDWTMKQTQQGLLFNNVSDSFVVTIAIESKNCYSSFQNFIYSVKKTGAVILNQKQTTFAGMNAYYIEADLPGSSTTKPQLLNYAILGTKNTYEIGTLNTDISSTDTSLRDEIIQSLTIDETNSQSATQCGAVNQ